MKDQLISFETAKLSKEIGFNEKCYWYCSYKRKVPTNNQSFYPDLGEYKDFNSNKVGFYESFSLPTQSLLQKWLRDNYAIHLFVQPHFTTEYVIKYYSCYFMQKGTETFLANKRDSYEIALEEGLFQALKDIKNKVSKL